MSIPNVFAYTITVIKWLQNAGKFSALNPTKDDTTKDNATKDNRRETICQIHQTKQ